MVRWSDFAVVAVITIAFWMTGRDSYQRGFDDGKEAVFQYLEQLAPPANSGPGD